MITAFDIGGANVKKLVYDQGEVVESRIIPFPMWKNFSRLENLLRKLGAQGKVAFVFTAELSDVFETKIQGVERLLEVCHAVFPNALFMDYNRRLLEYEEAKQSKAEIAGANFPASLYFLEKRFKEGILLDIGSTTTDIVPFRKGDILYGKSDLERLLKNQLLYTGCLRTPLCAIAGEVPFKGRLVKTASEFFAIAADVYTVLGKLANYACETPDGKGNSKEECMRRIARMLCSDLEEVGEEEIVKICQHYANSQISQISHQLLKVAEEYEIERVYIAGSGDFLGEEACRRINLPYVRLRDITPAYDNLPCLGLAEAVYDSY